MAHGTAEEAYFLPTIQFLIQYKQKQKGTSTNIHIQNQLTYNLDCIPQRMIAQLYFSQQFGFLP
jgi:hypothetical protein